MSALAIIVLTGLPYSYSKEPTKPDPAAQQSSAIQRGSEQSPLFVKSLGPTTQDEREYEAYEKREKPTNERKITNATVALAWITLALALFTALLWTTTYCLVRDAKKTAARQLRAYIFPEGSTICAANAEGKVLEPNRNITAGLMAVGMIQFKNTGQTPAYDVTIFGRMEMVDWPLVEKSLPPVDKKSFGASKEGLGPGGIRNKYDVHCVLTAKDIADLDSQRKAIFMYGMVRYRDAFKRQRFTNFRFFIGGAIWIRGPTLAAHETGNDADEDE